MTNQAPITSPTKRVGRQFDAARLDAVIDGALERKIVGTVVLVAHNGDCVYQRAAGFSDRETGAPIEIESVFRLASVTKPIVAAAALSLVERGAISLDDDIRTWLPDFRPRLADGSTPRICVRHLLTHTAGLSYCFLEPPGSFYHLAGISDGLAEPERGLAENLDLLAQAPLAFPPGTGWRYSLGFDVLGAVIERVADAPLSEVVAETVTDPLGMKTCGFHADDAVDLVTPYVDGAASPVAMHDGIEAPLHASHVVFSPARARSKTAYPSGGAGMFGSAGDMLRFFETIRLGGSPILAAETVCEMMRDQVGTWSAPRGPGWGFGYGWAVLSDPEAAATPQKPGTIQWGGAYGHSWFVDRSSGLTVVALTNTAFEGVSGSFPANIRGAVYAALGRS